MKKLFLLTFAGLLILNSKPVFADLERVVSECTLNLSDRKLPQWYGFKHVISGVWKSAKPKSKIGKSGELFQVRRDDYDEVIEECKEFIDETLGVSEEEGQELKRALVLTIEDRTFFGSLQTYEILPFDQVVELRKIFDIQNYRYFESVTDDIFTGDRELFNAAKLEAGTLH